MPDGTKGDRSRLAVPKRQPMQSAASQQRTESLSFRAGLAFLGTCHSLMSHGRPIGTTWYGTFRSGGLWPERPLKRTLGTNAKRIGEHIDDVTELYRLLKARDDLEPIRDHVLVVPQICDLRWF